MKDKVIKLLIKWGYNESDVLKKVDENFDDAIRTFPDATPAKIAKAITIFSYLY